MEYSGKWRYTTRSLPAYSVLGAFQGRQEAGAERALEVREFDDGDGRVGRSGGGEPVGGYLVAERSESIFDREPLLQGREELIARALPCLPLQIHPDLTAGLFQRAPECAPCCVRRRS